MVDKQHFHLLCPWAPSSSIQFIRRRSSTPPLTSSQYVLQYVLDHLDERWRDDAGTFAGALAATDPGLAGQCSRLWTVCYDLVAGMEREAAEMPAEVQKVHERLADLHHRLRELLEREHTTQDVDSLGGELNEIEAQRGVRGGVFGGDLEAPAPGNAACAELLSHNFGG